MKPNHAQEYQGPGKMWSAFGGWGVGGLIGGLATLPFRWNSIKSIFKGEIVKSTGLWVGSSLLVLASSTVGAIVGWNKGKNGQQQFENTQAQLANAENENTQLKQVIGTQAQTQKRFSDTVTSRSEQGSHAAAAEADKQQASVTTPTL
ncbi:MAG: hypothetical protein V4735_02400 [Pseudomonadota bacterium]